MAEDRARPIIVKKIKKAAHGHHGGAWKIAYADFVTAMMAFFLLMWLLGSSSDAQLEGLQEYFKMPLKVALSGGPKFSVSDSVIKGGGGKDLTKKDGQVKQADTPPGKVKILDISDAKKVIQKMERDKLEQLKAKIEAAIEASETLRKFKDQLKLDITTEGLRVQIVDLQNRPMFASSKAELQPYARQILREIGQMLNGVPNKISLSGHTDAVPYPSGVKAYSNWELSADRANASRRELIAGGMDETKLVRVVGLASAALYDKADPLNPVNRRINIIVMNKKAEEDALKDGGTIDLPGELPASAGGTAVEATMLPPEE